jgi:tetratricopeptide (TPR) repeat protein
VEKQRNRWLINAFLLVCVTTFVGIALIPLLGGLRPPAATVAPDAAGLKPEERLRLEDQAKGFAAVLQREPDNQSALRSLIEVQGQLGKAAEAIAPLEKLAKLNPQETGYAVLLAQLKQQTGDREGAAKVYREVLAVNPGDLKAVRGLVSLLLKQKRPEAAIGLLQDTIKQAPKFNATKPNSVDIPSINLILGQVYFDQKRFDEAIAVYEGIQKLDPQDFRPVLAKALVLKEQGKPEAAQPLFDSASALAPPQYKDEINRLAKGGAPGAIGAEKSTDGSGSAPGLGSPNPGAIPTALPTGIAPPPGVEPGVLDPTAPAPAGSEAGSVPDAAPESAPDVAPGSGSDANPIPQSSP